MKKTQTHLIYGIFLLTFALYSTMDIYVAFSPSLVQQFRTDERLMKFTFVIGPLVAMMVSHPIGFWFKRFSYRFLYPLTVVVFSLGCWFSGHSQLFNHFIFGRVIQAFALTGLAILNSSLLASLLDEHKERLGVVFQYYSGVFALIFLISPLLGSLIHTHLGFEWCFYIPVIVSVLALGMILCSLPQELNQATRSSNASFFSFNLFDKNLCFAAFPSSVSFLFSIHAPFFLSQWAGASSHAIATVQILPLLSQILASSLRKSFGFWPLVSGVLILIYSGVASLSLRPLLVVFAFCLFPFFLVPLMAKATAGYLQTKNKVEASAHLNFCRNLFISISTAVSALCL